jgi:hypothetical protein
VVFCERLSAHSRRTRRIATSTAYGLGDDASVIFAVDHEIGPLIFLTNMVLSGCGRRLRLRVPPWPRRRDASVERADAAATARRRRSP